MSSVRAHRVGEQMKKELSYLFQRELKDPRIDFVTVTGVEMTGDLSKANVYISVLGDEKRRIDTLKALDQASGYIRSTVGKKVRLRHTPELIFHFDDSIEYGSRIENLLNELNKNEEQE